MYNKGNLAKTDKTLQMDLLQIQSQNEIQSDFVQCKEKLTALRYGRINNNQNERIEYEFERLTIHIY